MKTDTLEAVLLPNLGGKISSLRRKGVELLQQALRPYAPRTALMSFEESDASGFDECLPSVAACEFAGPAGAIQVPDHGEFWRLPCKVEQHGEGEIRLIATGTVLPLRLERTLKLNGETLRVDYRLENQGEIEVPYLWSAHPLFAVDEGDEILLPPSVTRLVVEGSAHERLGVKGKRLGWPVAQFKDGGKADLSRAGKSSDGTGDKLYAETLEGWAAIDRRQHGLRVRVGFDASLTPYLGLWLCYGGWPEGQSARQQCVALEACTAPADSLAEAINNGFARKLAPGQSDSWWMTVAVSES